MIKLPVAPVAKPRMVQSDAWRGRKVVADYWEFKARLQAEAQRLGFRLGPAVRVIFIIPMPRSWSKKRKAEMADCPHTQRPDLDNLVKSLCDSLAPDDDSHIWKADAEKRWGIDGCILIENYQTGVVEK